MPSILVHRGQPLREADRRVLGDRVGDRVVDHQQAGRRRDIEQVAAALLEHVRDRVLGRVDLRHEVDADDLLPLLRGRLDPAVDGDAGVGDEEVDAPEALDRRLDEVLDVLLAADVGSHGIGADRSGGALGGVLTEVREHDLRALLGEAGRQREADAAGAAGHDGHLVLDVHGWSFPAVVGQQRTTVAFGVTGRTRAGTGLDTGPHRGVMRFAR